MQPEFSTRTTSLGWPALWRRPARRNNSSSWSASRRQHARPRFRIGANLIATLKPFHLLHEWQRSGSRYSAVLSLQDVRGGSAREGRPRAVSGRHSEGCLNRRIVANCGWSALPTPTARSEPQTSIGIPLFNATRRNLDKREVRRPSPRRDRRRAEARRRVRDVRISHFLTLAHAFAERDGTS